MINEIVQQNFIGIAICVFLILFVFTNNNFDKRTNDLFICSAVCVLLFIFEEMLESQLAERSSYCYLRVVLSVVGYTLRPMTAYFLVLMYHKHTRRWKFMISIPIILNTLVSMSSLFVELSFGYTQSNEFQRGPLWFVPFITAAFYLLTLFYITMCTCKKGDVMESLTVVMILVLAVTATVMETIFHFRFIQGAISGISIAFYYLFLHTNQNNRDLLTGALTRRRFYLDADRYHSILTAVISLDLNNLKVINDQYGHKAGDNALTITTETIKGCIGKNASLYRVGGDEFMILCYRQSEERVQNLIKRIQEEMAKTEYVSAIGYSMYSLHSGLQQACQIADEHMYENKLKTKAEKGN